MRFLRCNQILGSLLTATLVFLAGPSGLRAQGASISVGYEFFPASNLSTPDVGTFEENLEVTVATFSADFSLPAAVFSEGETVLLATFSYHRFDLDYTNWDDLQGGNRIDNAQGLEFELVVVRQLSERWNMIAVATPGIHSDLRGDRTSDEFILEAALIFAHQKSENLSLGFGAAYSFLYGEGLPIPLLSLQWTNGSSSRVDLLLPATAEFWYRPNQILEIGLGAKVAGNQYHGDPARYSVPNPQMRYSVGTFGPSARLQLSEKTLVTVDAGVTFLRRFEFFDGNVEQNSLDLKNSGTVRVGLQIGG